MHAFVSDPPDLRVALVLGLGGGLRAFALAVALSIHDDRSSAGRAANGSR
jgi:hypothetical protein